MNISNYAAISKETNIVIDNIMWDGESAVDPNLTENYTLIPWDENTKGYPINLGDTYIENENAFMPKKPDDESEYVWDSDKWSWVISNDSKIQTNNLINNQLSDIINSDTP